MDAHANVRTPLLGHNGNATSSDELPAPAGYTSDHPVFLRACHSPWRCLPQNHLCYVRGFLLAYLIGTGIMLWTYKAEQDESQPDCSAWRHIFDFAGVTFAMLLVYMAVVFSWTFTHLYFPNIDEHSSGWEYAVLRIMSIPTQLASLRKQFYFMLFYTATCVACFMNTFYYWVVSRPHSLEERPPSPPSASSTPTSTATTLFRQLSYPHENDRPFSDLFGEGWFATFNIINVYAVTSVIVLIEIFWLNSIKRPVASGPIVFGLILLAFLYLGWAAIGKIVTGCSAFFWLSEDEVGSREAVVVYCIGFVIIAPIMYAFFVGLTGIRETWTANRARARAMAAVDEASREHEH